MGGFVTSPVYRAQRPVSGDRGVLTSPVYRAQRPVSGGTEGC